MRIVAHYNVIDSVRVQSLLVARNLDQHAGSNAIFVELQDSHYYAGGMKVCAMLGAYATRSGFACSTIPPASAKKGKYPGAFVFFPKKRGSKSTPNYRSRCGESVPLGDSCAYNLSPKRSCSRKKRPITWNLKAKNCTKFRFRSAAKRSWAGVCATRRDKPEEKGLYPTVLEDLGGKRGDVKKILAPLKEMKELIEEVMGNSTKKSITLAESVQDIITAEEAEIKVNEKTLPTIRTPDEKEELEYKTKETKHHLEALRRLSRDKPPDQTLDEFLRARYPEVCFLYTKVDSKQKAIKVFMNTFYGKAGNSISPFFLLQLAGGTTSAGQFITKSTADFVISLGYIVVYGDTDSLYLICPDKIYEKCDADFAAGRITKEQYWIAMVRVTMRDITELRDRVNKFCIELTKTKIIRFAYEEVLFPCAMCGKKKYFGIPHINIPNFRPKKLFIRGIETVKQGQMNLSREMGNRIMWGAMKIDNDKTLLQITEDVVRDAVTNSAQWKLEDFCQTGAWKPDKEMSLFTGSSRA